ncbi:DYNLRB2 isoform 4 [Pan troglodytes]|uniref:DYNLRB2 isoform 4 n=1 Tax=Pan troglodytes TaxID=9598 RepID=A0A2J8LEC7_PANTR|nr:DYNLRB2 isoform 4 [Pan troglodytes]
MAEVEETLKRIQSHKGVIGTMVVNAEDPRFVTFKYARQLTAFQRKSGPQITMKD